MALDLDPQISALIPKITETLQAVGTKIGEGAVAGWDLLVKKVFWIDGVIPFSFGIIGVILSITLPILFWRLYSNKWHKSLNGSEDVQGLLIAIGSIGTGGMLVLFFISVIDGIISGVTHMAVPEYYAVMQLVDMFK